MDDDATRPGRAGTAGRLSALTALLLALGGCSQTMDIETASVRQAAPLEEAFVMPPPGGPAIVAVIEERKGRTATQRILLESASRTPGEDGFRVEIAARSGDRIATPHNVNAGMRAALPGLRMQVSPYLTQNRYGPFGYAVGRGKGSDLCIYGWQTVQSRSTLFMNQGKVDVRLRLCRTGATETQLLGVMYGYTITAFLAEGQWNPYRAQPLSAAVGAPGHEIYPVGQNGPAPVLQQAAVEPQPARAPRRAAPTDAPAPVRDSSVVVPPPPSGPVVPLPPAARSTVLVPPPPSP